MKHLYIKQIRKGDSPSLDKSTYLAAVLKIFLCTVHIHAES